MSIYRLKGTSGSVINQSFSLSTKLLIGRSDDCDIRIDHDSVAAHQAEILLLDGGGVRLCDLGSTNAIRLNGKPVSDAMMSGGDEIHVGNCRLMLQAPGLRPDRVVHADATRATVKGWPWLVALLVMLAIVLAWQSGVLDGLPV